VSTTRFFARGIGLILSLAPVPPARCARPPLTQRASSMTTDGKPTRLLLLVQALLWLAAAVASALLVYWLYVDPAYGMPWSAETGAVLFALVGIFAAAGCLCSLRDMMHTRPPRVS